MKKERFWAWKVSTQQQQLWNNAWTVHCLIWGFVALAADNDRLSIIPVHIVSLSAATLTAQQSISAIVNVSR